MVPRFIMASLLPAAVVIVLLLPARGADLRPAETLLTAPGRRLVKDPAVVIPALNPYLNRPPSKPVYRDGSGRPVPGWRRRYIATRRFASNHSAWLYYRLADLDGCQTIRCERGARLLRIWPASTTMVLESYRGNAPEIGRAELLEILVMHKMSGRPDKSFYPADWSYARFDARGAPALTPQTLRKCHQCHSIAFRLTGDLVFTRFP